MTTKEEIETFDSKYLVFKLDEMTKDNLTQIYIIKNKTSSDILGYIRWYGAWRQYTYYTSPQCYMAKSCLVDINRFIDLLMKQRKENEVKRIDSNR